MIPTTGLTEVANGLLAVNGTIDSNAQVDSGATLGGNGTINGNVTAQSGGTVSPGLGTGSAPGNTSLLNLGSNLSLTTGSVFVADLNGTSPGTRLRPDHRFRQYEPGQRHRRHPEALQHLSPMPAGPS